MKTGLIFHYAITLPIKSKNLNRLIAIWPFAGYLDVGMTAFTRLEVGSNFIAAAIGVFEDVFEVFDTEALPKIDEISKICELFNIDPRWLVLD